MLLGIIIIKFTPSSGERMQPICSQHLSSIHPLPHRVWGSGGCWASVGEEVCSPSPSCVVRGPHRRRPLWASSAHYWRITHPPGAAICILCELFHFSLPLSLPLPPLPTPAWPKSSMPCVYCKVSTSQWYKQNWTRSVMQTLVYITTSVR